MTADLPAAAAAPGAATIIEARTLVKSVGDTPALRGASLGARAIPVAARYPASLVKLPPTTTTSLGSQPLRCS